MGKKRTYLDSHHLWFSFDVHYIQVPRQSMCPT